MAQDATYITKTYHERDGERYVAASGGTIAVESGGSALFANSATLTLASGANLSIIAGATLGFAGQDIEADDMRRVLVSEWGAAVNVNFAAGISVLADSNIPRNARIVNVIGSLAASKASIWLTSVSAGRDLWLRLVGDMTGTFTNNNTSLAIITSGCILLGSLGGAIASITLHTSAASDAGLYLRAVADDTWAIITEFGNNAVES